MKESFSSTTPRDIETLIGTELFIMYGTGSANSLRARSYEAGATFGIVAARRGHMNTNTVKAVKLFVHMPKNVLFKDLWLS